MKKLLTIIFTSATITLFAQSKADSVILTPKQEQTILMLDKQITELQTKQRELIEFIFDSNKISVDSIAWMKYEPGKLFYSKKKFN